MRLGLPYGDVDVIGSDPSWSTTAAQWITDLNTVLDGFATAIEHVGSTAVPGLSAKPIIDLAVRLVPGADVDAVVAVLADAGYVYRGRRVEVGDWLFHRLTSEGLCAGIVHVVGHDDPSWSRWLAVRDRLRDDPVARRRYADVKLRLALQFPTDRESYSRGKADLLQELIADSERNDRSGGTRDSFERPQR